MTYGNMNGFPASNGLGLPGAGFASRGKGNRPQRLTLASPPKVGSISENSIDGIPNPPRTSRSHLLAGLRTQPRTPGAVPASAPYNKTSHGNQFGYSQATPQYHQSRHAYANVPHTAIGSNFPPGQHQQLSLTPGQQLYGLPEQVLAPPPLEIDDGDEHMDPQLAAQLYATQMYLQERQQQLQQLALQNQMAGMSIQGQLNKAAHASFPQTPVTPQQVNVYAQPQIQNHGNGIITQEVTGQPGVYVVYNTLTGQSTLAIDPAVHQTAELANSPPPPTPSAINTKFNNDNSVPYDTGSPFGSRSRSPPKKTSSPAAEVTPLPPPSANAFRRGHNRNRSSLALNNVNNTAVGDGPKSSRPAGIPATPMTGTFGPGHGRAGEHPIRQPIGPPSFDELQKAPTSRSEGSKNFSSRQRRRALNTLVRAGIERRVARPGSGNGGSAGSMTPVSDTEHTFSVPSDNDSDSGRSLSGKLSIGSLRAAASGAIGSERMEMRKRSTESIRSGNLTPAEGNVASSNVLVGLGASS